MSKISRVAIAGATGNLGPAIVQALLEAGFEVTALSRHGSTSIPPKGAKLMQVDFASTDSLAVCTQRTRCSRVNNHHSGR